MKLPVGFLLYLSIMADARRINQAAPTPSAPGKRAAVSASSTSTNKPGPTSSAPARPTEASSSAAPRPATQRSGSAESDEADAAQQRRKDNWMQAHWNEFSSRADRNPSYVVVFDQSPAEVRAAVVSDILGGTEPKLSTMTCDLSFLDKAFNKPDLGEVQVAIMEAENFSALSHAFETYTTTVVKSKGQPRRTAFVPVKARPHRASARD